VAVGLAIVIAVYRLRRTTDVAEVRDLRDADQGPLPPLRLEGEDAHHEVHEPHEGPEAGGHSEGTRPELEHAHAAHHGGH
jgi:hypothetical protein